MTTSLEQSCATQVIRTVRSEWEKREAARQTLLDFTLYTFEGYEVNWHHAIVADYLDRWAAGRIRRLIIEEPPRHGKSEQVSRRLPAFILGRNPDVSIIACSYGGDLASRMNRDVQRIIDTPQYHILFPQTQLFSVNVRTLAQGTYLRNSDLFEVVGRKGAYQSAGIGGAITGAGMNYGIVDDPVKNEEEAQSETYREAVWEWYTTTFATRQEKDACILITCTRWHEDDLVGRVLALAEQEGGEQWTVVRFPALFEPGCMPEDERTTDGEALWPNRFTLEFLHAQQVTLGSHRFAALYQQRPAPREGSMFPRAGLAIVDAPPVTARRVRYWDKAGTADGGKYSAGVLMAEAGGLYYVLDVVRGQWSSGERNRIMKQVAALDARHYGNTVDIWTEQEPGSGGKESAEISIHELAGYPVHAEPVTGSKEVRAEPYAAQVEAGNVRLVAGVWNAQYVDELTSFPHGRYSDQVDGSSGAFNKLALPERGGYDVFHYAEQVRISPY